MLRLRSLLIVACAAATTGCLALAAGAAGGALVSGDNEEVERYVATHDVEPRIAEAMYEGRIVEGMNKDQVGLLFSQSNYNSCEKETKESRRSTWTCDSSDPMWTGTYLVQFEDGKVVSVDTP